MSFQVVKLTIKGTSRDRKFTIELDPTVPLNDLKEEIVNSLGEHFDLALNPDKYRLEMKGSFEDPEVLLIEI